MREFISDVRSVIAGVAASVGCTMGAIPAHRKIESSRNAVRDHCWLNGRSCSVHSKPKFSYRWFSYEEDVLVLQPLVGSDFVLSAKTALYKLLKRTLLFPTYPCPAVVGVDSRRKADLRKTGSFRLAEGEVPSVQIRYSPRD